MNARSLCLLAVAVAVGGAAAVAQRGDDVTIKTIPVRGSISMLEGRGGNIGISAGADGVLMIDDQFDFLAEKIQAAVDALGKGRIKYVLNTHWHGDHTGGNPFFGKSSPIIAHENVRKRLASGGRGRGPAAPEALPVITYANGLSIHFNGEEVRVVHFPHGHTDGDSIVFFTKSNVVHMGDHFFSGRFPFIDLDSGGDVEGFMKNIDRVIEMLPADVKIIPGHGPLSTLEDLRASRAMLRETTAIVRERIAAGKSLEEIKEAGLPEKWDSWSWRFISTDRWLDIVYRSLRKA